MKKWIWIAFCFFTQLGFAWDSVGHRLIAQIAYDTVNVKTRQVLKQYGHLHARAVYPDRLAAMDIHTFDHWHYQNILFQTDGNRVSDNEKHHIFWAIAQAQHVWQQTDAPPLEKSTFLNFLIHLVGDIHQPMHCYSHVSKKFPQGDGGGNGYAIHFQNSKNLHQLWDRGLGLWSHGAHAYSSTAIRRLAGKIRRQYPPKFFGDAIENDEVSQWCNAAYPLVQAAYKIPENGSPSAGYLQQYRPIVAQRIALAGYRLARILEQNNTKFVHQ